MSPTHPERKSFVQLPTNYFIRPDMRPLRKRWTRHTDWLMAVMILCQECRAAGELRMAGVALGVDDLVDVPGLQDLDPAWIDAMLSAGLFERTEDGAILVSCRRQFLAFWSDGQAAERQRSSRAKKPAATCHELSQLVTNCHESPVTPVQVVTNSHESAVTPVQPVTNGHELSRIVTNDLSQQRNLSQLVTTRHDINKSNPIEEKENKSNPIQSKRTGGRTEPQVAIAQGGRGRTSRARRKIEIAFASELERLTPPPGRPRDAPWGDRVAEALSNWIETHQDCDDDSLCAALRYAAQRTKHEQEQGRQINLVGPYVIAVADGILPQVLDRAVDRAAAHREGWPDPGPLEFEP